jgi:hypothetical protein
MRPGFAAYFQDHKMQLHKRGRPGQHEPDWVAVDASGDEYPVEEKERAEIPLYSNWWTYWSEGLLVKYKGTGIEGFPSQVRGWISVIDGELRDWVSIANVEVGYSVAEASSSVFGRPMLSVRAAIDSALQFLDQQGALELLDKALMPPDHYVIAVKYQDEEPTCRANFGTSAVNIAHGGDTTMTAVKCPKCRSANVAVKKIAKRVGVGVGVVAGGTAGALGGAKGGAAAGAAIGMIFAGPAGAGAGAIAGATVGALTGAAGGGYVGNKAGELIDKELITRYRCTDCGHVFKVG